MRDDSDGYWRAVLGANLVSGIPDLSQDPIFLAGDPAEVAKEVFALPVAKWSSFLSPIKERVEGQERFSPKGNDSPISEREWFRAFRSAATEIANAATPIRKAQMTWVLEGRLGFLDVEN
ncbi:MAG: hypothetical protein U1A24_02220 [Cypionkella sp.]|uniref:hypothetical protein n=1 Tax=Cypionkella sp. TaxID=2811411 RepID=UPI002ABC36D3|nr:hypothetical protein [Cypionkella sp.]MDZ4309363.1 hypothetical protein [Cypionkella sp.]